MGASLSHRLALGVQEHVVRFDVSVDDAMLVHESERMKQELWTGAGKSGTKSAS